MPNLQTLLNDIEFESLPPAWTTHDLGAFSRAKRLWDYQQTALQNALTALWKYYGHDHPRALLSKLLQTAPVSETGAVSN